MKENSHFNTCRNIFSCFIYAKLMYWEQQRAISEIKVNKWHNIGPIVPTHATFLFWILQHVWNRVLCEFRETKYHSEGLFPVRAAGEATLRYTPFMCWFRFWSNEQSTHMRTRTHTHTHTHTCTQCQTCTRTLTSWRKASSVCGPSEKCEVGPGFLSGSCELATLNLLTQTTHTHTQAATHIHSCTEW